MENKIDNRNYKFDNLKAILIFTVVLGHLLRGIPGNISKLLYVLIYTFHMPVFCFITGYWSNKEKKGIVKMALYYIVFQVLYTAYSKYFLGEDLEIQLIEPYWILWYIFAMIIWRLSLKIFDRKSKLANEILLLITVVMSIVIGFINKIGFAYSLSRIFVFFPYFLLGYYIKNNKIHKKHIKRHKSKVVKNIIILSVWIVYMIIIAKNISLINIKIFYGLYSYAILEYSYIFRIIMLILNVLTISLLLDLVPNKEIKYLSYIGKNTLIIYLLHGFIVKIILEINLFRFAEIYNIILAVIISGLILILSKLDINLITDKLLNYIKNIIKEIHNQIKESKIILSAMVLIAVILCIPSVLYVINNNTVDDFNAYYTYILQEWTNEITGMIDGFIIIGGILLFGICYIFVIKNQDNIFKNRKQILSFIMIISFIFMLILPFLSSDIYYYIGDSWLAAKYGENPYYTTVADLQNQGISDEILKNTGPWSHTTSVYGPLWNSISKVWVSLSFGNITIALFIFKITAYFVHIINSYLMYKITKSNKYMLLYGLNPLVLLEFLSNVHNDIYLLLFILLALYFLIRKKNIIFTIIFLGLSISIKYSTVLLVPFILIYYFRNKTIPKRILFCLIFGLAIMGIIVLMYLPYYRDLTIFTNMLVQGTKYSQSIMSFLRNNIDSNIFNVIKLINIPVFIIVYLGILFILLFKKRIKLKDVMQKYNFMMLIFIFVVLTTFQKWYILWVLPTMMWQNKNMRRFIIALTITALIPSFQYFKVGGDLYTLGITYSINMLICSGLIILKNT